MSATVSHWSQNDYKLDGCYRGYAKMASDTFPVSVPLPGTSAKPVIPKVLSTKIIFRPNLYGTLFHSLLDAITRTNLNYFHDLHGNTDIRSGN
jgi:hypothetical protein